MDAAPINTTLDGQKCFDFGEAPGLSAEHIDTMMEQLADGWAVVQVDGCDRIRKEWEVKDFMTGLEFFQAIAQIAEDQGHHPDLHLVGYHNVTIEMWTHTTNGLSPNDFIVAYLIDKLDAPQPKA